MPSYPTRGTDPWDNPLKDYIDGSIPPAVAAAVAASPTVANAAAAAVAGVVAGQKIVLWNKMPTLFTNYVRNPGAEVDLADWNGNAGNVERDTSIHKFGTASFKITPGVNDYSGAGLSGFQGLLTAGKPYTISFWVYTPKVLPSVNFSADWMAAGYTTNLPLDGYVGAALPIGWTRVIMQGYAGTTGGPQQFRRTATAGGSTQDPFWIDGVTLTDGFTVPDFFDGDSPGCFWLGTAHASASVKAAYVKDEVFDAYKMPVLGRNAFTNPMFRPSPDRHFGSNGTATEDGMILGRRSVRFHRANTDPGGMYVGQSMFLNAGLWTLTAWGRLVSGSAVIYPTVFKEDFTENFSDNQSGNAPTLVTYEDRLITQQFNIPAGGRLVLILFDQGKPNGDPWTTNDVFDIGGVSVTPGAGPVPATDLVVGSDPGSRWLGAPENSASVRLLPTREQTLVNAPELARNLVFNPSGQNDVEGWIASAGLLVVDKTTYADSQASMKWTADSAGSAGMHIRQTATQPRTVGAYYRAQAKVRPNVTLTMRIASNNNDMSTPYITCPANQWTTLTTEAAVSTVTSNLLYIQLGVPSAGQVVNIGDIMLTEGQGKPDYFDGDSPGCKWLGERGKSASVKMLANKKDLDFLVWLDAGHAQGVGSPEGKVAAPVGARYVDTKGALADGGMGAIEWTKMSGTNANGWKVTVGDTGWRNLNTGGYANSAILTQWDIRIRRINSEVHVRCQVGFGPDVPAGSAIYTFPAGFQTENGGLEGNSTGNHQTGYNGGGSLVAYGIGYAGQYLVFNDVLLTNNDWPATLPGTPL